VHLIRTHHPDVVFLDVQMPGWTALRTQEVAGAGRCRSHCHRSFLPRLFDQYAVRAFDVNAIDYLLKPFDRARVLQALERARQRRRSASTGTGAIAEENGTLAEVTPSDARLDASCG